ncbi:Nicotinate-nucleotide pyrophosphorylase [carboxylating] [Paragonimus heterotremus]|uniref:Quinolinate phosphoribosyltransferase [decarboxylating] n=1 Tax=Paragonimus heterotremus TaxID=100268 RepID=A0A8J4T2C5_9TREM|nr:Nicotinate-nucleotide pyrophosphorylase [carboxylating] [Paragonimus heterotremus]
MATPFVLNKQIVRNLVSSWLSDEAEINFVGFTLNNERSKATIFAPNGGVLSGSSFVEALFNECGCAIEWHFVEGDSFPGKECKVATATGPLNDLVFCERLAVDILSRAGGITTFAKRLQKGLADVAWKGSLKVGRSHTPGFGLIEEYAMLLAGVVLNRSSVYVRQCHAKAAGGIEKAVCKIRSIVDAGTKIEVECSNLADALKASAAGADMVVFHYVPVKELNSSVTQLKSAHPRVEIQVTANFDDSDLKTYALSNVDFLTSLKLTSGYPLLDFQVHYEAVSSETEPIQLKHEVAPNSTVPPPTQTTSQSPGPEPVNEIVSPTAPAPKKSRLNDDSQSGGSPKPGSKQNGTPTQISNSPASTLQSNTAKEQNQKRAQRNQRSQHNAQQRQSLNRSQSPGGMQLLQMTAPRFVSPNALQPRAQLGTTMNNPFQGMLSPNNSTNNLGLRLPGQSLPQRMGPGQSMNPGMLGSGPNVGAAFLGMQSSQSQQNAQQSSWQMMPGGAGSMMGGVGLGMRMGGPGSGNVINCRACGASNGPGSPFCRNCRVPFR